MTALERHRSLVDQALTATACLGPDGSPMHVEAAVDWLGARGRELRRTSGSVFFIGVGAGDPQSHHFAAAFYRRVGIRGIALGETPFRNAAGDPARAAETLAQWFARPGDIVVDLLESTPPDRARVMLEGAARLGMRTVAFTRRLPDLPLGAIGQLTFFIPSDDVCVCDSVQHCMVSAWIAAVRGQR